MGKRGFDESCSKTGEGRLYSSRTCHKDYCHNFFCTEIFIARNFLTEIFIARTFFDRHFYCQNYLVLAYLHIFSGDTCNNVTSWRKYKDIDVQFNFFAAFDIFFLLKFSTNLYCQNLFAQHVWLRDEDISGFWYLLSNWKGESSSNSRVLSISFQLEWWRKRSMIVVVMTMRIWMMLCSWYFNWHFILIDWQCNLID